MGEMIVEGRDSVDVPYYLDGLVVAGNQVRLRAHLIDLLPLVVVFVFHLVGRIVGSASNDRAQMLAAAIQWLGLPLVILYALVTVCLTVIYGQTVGMKVAGVRWIAVTNGVSDRLRNLTKLGLYICIGILTLGIGPVLICVLTQDQYNRTWLDRVCGTLTMRLPEPVAPVAPRRAEARRWGDTVAEAKEATIRVVRAGANQIKRYNLHVVPAEGPAKGVVNDVPTLDEAQEGEEAEWVQGTQASAMDLAGLSRSLVDSRRSVEGGLPLSDDHTLSRIERTIGMRPKGSVRLLFDDGTRYDLVGTVLIGRDPVSTGRFQGAAVLAIEDSARSVSKVHLAVSARDGQVLVEDLYSTNGSSCSTQGGETRELVPGAPQLATAGSVIRFGNRKVMIAG